MDESVYEPMQSSDIGELAGALAKAQSEMEGAKKDANNLYFKSDYATLFSVWQACRDPLTKNGLSVIQTTGNGGDKITVYTTLAHSSGQWVRGALSIRPGKTDPQTLGSCITYLRRYALASMVGLSPLDDDAEAAMSDARKQVPRTVTQQPETHADVKTGMKAYLDSMAKAKAHLNKLTGSDDVYYSALKYFDIQHANDMKDMVKAQQLLDQLRTFAKNRKNEHEKNEGSSACHTNDGEKFPPEEN